MVALRQNRHRQAAPQQEHREGLRAPEVPKIRGGIPGSMSSVAGTAQLIPQLSRGAYPAHTPAQPRCLPSSCAGASQPTGPTRSAAGSSSIERVRRSQCYAACSGSERDRVLGRTRYLCLQKSAPSPTIITTAAVKTEFLIECFLFKECKCSTLDPRKGSYPAAGSQLGMILYLADMPAQSR